MGTKYTEISDKLREFIEAQKVFFVGTAAAEGRVNVSPKGMDSLRVLGENRVVWLNMTGSGNETSAHVQSNARMTLMFAAFEGNPRILRLYGEARVIHRSDPEWAELSGLFDLKLGARQVFDLEVDLVQSSCGTGVPLLEYAGDRDQLKKWAERKGEAGVRQYWHDKNQVSLDGAPTHVVEKNG